MKKSNIIKIEGFKVFYDDGEVHRKDPNNIWMYRIFLGKTPWENRKWYEDENGRLELEFPEI